MDPEQLIMREAKLSDLRDIIALLQDDKMGISREGGERRMASYEAAFHAINQDPNHYLLVAEYQGELLGTLQLSFLPNLTFSGAWRAQIEGVRIKAEHRGRGLGEKLLKEAIQRAKVKGCKIVQLTMNKNRDSDVFYKKLGFEDSHIGFKLYL